MLGQQYFYINQKRKDKRLLTQPLLVNEETVIATKGNKQIDSNDIQISTNSTNAADSSKEKAPASAIIISNEKSPLIITKNSPYRWNEIAFDTLLLAFAVWAQFGYAFYSQENAFETLSDPMERFLYPHIISQQADEISEYLEYITKALSFADAALTAGTYLNMRHTRRELTDGLKKGWQEYKNKKISPALFVISCFLILSCFVAGSFPPWTGFERKNYNILEAGIFGITMFIGLMISYSMSYAPYIFSASKNLTDFHKLSLKEKKEILHNIFCTKKGLLGFLPRSVVSIINRSWIFYGSANLTATWVFKTHNPYIRYPYAALASSSSGYQTLMSQGIKDYKVTFEPSANSTKSIEPNVGITLNKTNKNHSIKEACNSIRYYSFSGILGLLVVAVFILRTLAVPSLYTGEINDPANNYNYKDAALSLLGLLLGAYGAFQYSRFRYSRWQDNFACFFNQKATKLSNLEKIDNDDSTVNNINTSLNRPQVTQ